VTNIGTWNVRSLYKTGGLAQLIREMRNYDLQILGISEMRWTGSGTMSSEGHCAAFWRTEAREGSGSAPQWRSF